MTYYEELSARIREKVYAEAYADAYAEAYADAEKAYERTRQKEPINMTYYEELSARIREETREETVKALMASTGWTEEQARKALQLSENQPAKKPVIN